MTYSLVGRCARIGMFGAAAHWLQLQTMGTGYSLFTVFFGLGVIGLASLCAICIPSAHPSSKVQYVGLQSSVSLAGWPLSQLPN